MSQSPLLRVVQQVRYTLSLMKERFSQMLSKKKPSKSSGGAFQLNAFQDNTFQT